MWAIVGARERIRKLALTMTPDSILALDDEGERFSASESSELMAAVAEINLRQSKFQRLRLERMVTQRIGRVGKPCEQSQGAEFWRHCCQHPR